jgi:hypothetical protein
MVAPLILPVAVAGGLGRFDLSCCAQISEEKNMAINAKTNPLVIIVFFIVVKI